MLVSKCTMIQERRKEAKRQKRGLSIKNKHASKCWRSIMVTIAIVPSLVKKARVSAGTNRACSNRESKKDKYNYGKLVIVVGKICAKAQPICYRNRSKKELLQL